MSMQYVHDKFIYEHNDVPEDKRAVCTEWVWILKTLRRNISISLRKKTAAFDQLEDKLNTFTA